MENESESEDTLNSISTRTGSRLFEMNSSVSMNRKSFPLNNDGRRPCWNEKQSSGLKHQDAVGASSTRKNLCEAHSDIMTPDDSDDHDIEDLDDADRMLPGVLAKGTAYTINQVIFHGYLDKKGSGFDWIGSRAWKPRWAVLVKARSDGHHVDVPLLQIFWDCNSPSPSTVISLDSAVILPENKLDQISSDNKHPFRFKIRHVKKSVNPETSLQMTRIFGCSGKNERDQWVYSMNRALLYYEKEKASTKKLSSLSLSLPRGVLKSWVKEDVMPQSKANRQRKFSSPPLSPS